MAKIVKLDEQLSNKIAAGEVVERPASIVKELVENAIDAGSTHIIIDVKEGGLTSIRIVDNGEGIAEDDVETAFYRHATSKIKTDKDLFKILTLGFRGEALPSIASVSFVELITCNGQGPGTRINLEGGNIVSKTKANSRKGTEVIVTNLFYNTPARLKYLKTMNTELGNISDIINRLALANPFISFEFIHNDKTMLHTSGTGDKLQVIASIFGKSVARTMFKTKAESIDFRVAGFITKPDVTRASRNYISLFINGRYIRNYSLVRAIMEGYHTLLPVGRYPIVVLSIEMDPLLIDVNVHPSKLEVRLSKEEELMGLISECIKETFRGLQLIPNVIIPKSKSEITEQVSLPFSQIGYEPKNDFIKESNSGITREVPSNKDGNVEAKDKQYLKVTNVSLPEEDQETQEVQESQKVQRTQGDQKTQEAQEAPAGYMMERIPVLYPIGQMHGTYILAQNENGLYIIDQHAAQERMKYEYFREKVGQVKAEMQDLLIPITFECTRAEAIILEENLDILKEIGVFLESFGPQAFIVRSHPTWFSKGEEEETIKELVQQVLDQKKIDIKKFREEAAILMACKASIKSNRYLRQDEMFALLESLRKCQDPFTCPHGRPILIHFTSYEMEKMFKRVM